MDLNDIRVFAKVAELKSFAKAAEELGIQVSFASRSVARLEATLGIRLLHRTTRKVSLTEEGSHFLAETSQGLDQLRSAVDSLHSIHGAPRGKVRISSGIEIGQYLVENIMTNFFKQYPEVQVEWDLLSTKSIVESNVDLTIGPARINESSTIEKKIGALSFRLYQSPKIKLNLSKRPTEEELNELPWLMFIRGPIKGTNQRFPLIVDKKQIEMCPKTIRFRTNSLRSIRHAIVEGVGVGLLPLPIAEPDIKSGRVIPVLPNLLSGPTVEFFVSYASRMYLPPKTRVLIDWLAHHFPREA